MGGWVGRRELVSPGGGLRVQTLQWQQQVAACFVLKIRPVHTTGCPRCLQVLFEELAKLFTYRPARQDFPTTIP